MNIKKILDEHNLWLQTGGKEGARADFSYIYFRGSKKSFWQGVDVRRAQGMRQWQAPQGEKRNICYSVKYHDCAMHWLGRDWRTTDEAVEAIRKKYGQDSLYETFLLMQVEALESEFGSVSAGVRGMSVNLLFLDEFAFAETTKEKAIRLIEEGRGEEAIQALKEGE
jgi:hypothetical protein